MEKLLAMLNLTNIASDESPCGIQATKNLAGSVECNYPDGSQCKCDCGFCPCSQCYSECDCNCENKS